MTAQAGHIRITEAADENTWVPACFLTRDADSVALIWEVSSSVSASRANFFLLQFQGL